MENWVRKKDVAHSYKVVPYYQLEMEWNKSYKFMAEHNFGFTGVSKILLTPPELNMEPENDGF